MDKNEEVKRCCIWFSYKLRSDTLKNPYMDPDQLTIPYTARLPTTSITATTYIDDSIHRKHSDSPDPSIPTTSFRTDSFGLYIPVLITIKYIYDK